MGQLGMVLFLNVRAAQGTLARRGQVFFALAGTAFETPPAQRRPLIGPPSARPAANLVLVLPQAISFSFKLLLKVRIRSGCAELMRTPTGVVRLP